MPELLRQDSRKAKSLVTKKGRFVTTIDSMLFKQQLRVKLNYILTFRFFSYATHNISLFRLCSDPTSSSKFKREKAKLLLECKVPESMQSKINLTSKTIRLCKLLALPLGIYGTS